VERSLECIANTIRKHVIEMTSSAGSGHPGGSLSSAELLTVLYFKVMRHDPKDPNWDGRDKFVLSKGHVAPVLYAALAEAGYFPVEDLITLRKINSKLQGHPVKGKTPGVEMSTGSLGQGLSMACGMSIAARLDEKDTRIYCLLGDGELQSGQIWEAAMLAGHYSLGNITAFVDRNHLQITGDTEKALGVDPIADKWKAFRWNVISINGHNICEIIDACESAKCSDKPTMVIMDTVKGKGVSFMEGKAEFHGRACNCDERVQAMKELEGSE
jgi:Transketolase, N-terminal subunit